MISRAVLALVTFWPLIFQPAIAGSSCVEQKIGPDEVRKAMQLAFKTRQVVEQVNTKVALVGRVGSDLSEHGLRYSHMGALVRDHSKGKWIFVHLLNECGSSRSDIFNEGLVNYYLDDPFEYEAVVIVPSKAYQERLADVLQGPLVLKFHNPNYNMIAFPWSQRYQNSNQWLGEIIAAAHAPRGVISSRAEAQQYLQKNGFTGDPIKIPALKRLGARLFRANVQLGEHEEKGYYGTYETVTVRALVRFLEKIDVPEMRKVVSLDRPDSEASRY